MKTCTRCGNTKPIEAFHRTCSTRDGRHTICGACVCAQKQAAYAAHPEKRRASERKKWRDDAEYRAAGAKRAREWRVKNPERSAAVNKAAGRVWRLKHPEAFRRYGKKYREANPEKEQVRLARYRRERREEINARARERQKTEPGRLKSKRHSALRRARKRAVTVGPVDLKAIYARDGGRCWICWRSIPLVHVHFDHVIPLARGGEHTAENIRTCCQPCNDRKLHRLPTPEMIGAIREEVLALVA